MKEYEFNDFGVCINPDEVSYDSGRCGYTLATAYTDDKWMMGYDAHKSANGVAIPICKRGGGSFTSQDEALKHAAQKVLDFFGQNHYTDDNSDRYALVPKDIIAKLDEVLHPQPVQLTLFDW